jgi:type I restriction enzyme, S subunit
MTADLRPYPEYKDPRLSWLGQVPLHWEEKRAKYYFREVDERSATGEEQLMSVSHVTGVTPRKRNVTMFMAESNTGHKLCRPGDLVINTMWAWMAAMGVARQTGLVSPSYGVYRPHGDSGYSPEYVDHLLRTQPYASEYLCRSTGIRASRLRLYPDDFLDIPIVHPPRAEQEAIVRFISHQDRKVRRFIRNRRRLIEVLNEQKQAIINRAVTRGLDPNVPLKPSGIDWLGDIPQHWDATTLGRLVSTFKTGPFGSILHQSDYMPGGVPLVNPVHMSGGRITPDRNCAVDDATFHRLRDYALLEGDIVFSRRGELGRCALVRKEEAGWLIGTGSIRTRLIPSAVDPNYLIAALQGQWVSDYLSLMSVGATMQSLNTGILSRLPLPLPPKEEQEQIPIFIERESHRVDEAIDNATREIDLIREYRTRLIADVVTGKVDVRHLAPPPGEEPIESEELAEDIDDDEPQPDDDPDLVEEE